MKLFLLGVLIAVAVSGQSITVTPSGQYLQTDGGQLQFSAAVTGLTPTTVKWEVVGGAANGTISSAGLYKAPGTVGSTETVTVRATSTVNTSVTGTQTVDLRNIAPVITNVSPASTPTGAFTFTLTGTGFQPGGYVTINGVGFYPTYISPTQQTVSGTMKTAGKQSLDVANPNSFFSNVVSVSFTAPTANTVTISPASSSVAVGSTRQFTALLNGVATTATWAVKTSGGGSITSAGLYTAPAKVPSPATVTISATVSGQPAVTATVTVTAPTPPATITVSPASITMYTGATQQFSALLSGVAQTAAWAATAGSITSSGLYTAPANPASVTITATVNGYAAATASVSISAAPPPGVVSASAARHFLQQAAFGPDAASSASVQQLGFAAWLAQQYGSPKVSNYSGLGDQGGMPARFIANAVNQPDQLRQRVAFALSQIFVTSINVNIWNGTVAPYEEMLMTDAFTNYRQIMYDVTLSAAMGQMLNMANNGKANASGTVLANENYAREIMQLFTVGTSMLNTDGSKQLDSSGNPIPVYSQSTVSNFAKVFTGWTYAPTAAGGAVEWGAYINPNSPMVPYEPEHDTTVKTLLSYAAPAGVLNSLPAGQSSAMDLNEGLDNIFYHPNVGPFVSRLLIQHLVKSNPSPDYIKRVATIFNSNPQGVRGDMQAVISAILLDPEARQNDAPGQTQATDGHLQEPLLFIPGVLRALSATVTDQNYFPYDLGNMEQDLYNPPSVFNYYSPGYVIPGFGLSGPEFQIYDTYSSLYRDNVVSELFGSYSDNVNSYGPATTVDLTPYVAMAGNPTALVNALDQVLTNGEMPSGLKQILVTAVQAEQGGALRQVQTALYLLLSSGYYNVWN